LIKLKHNIYINNLSLHDALPIWLIQEQHAGIVGDGARQLQSLRHASGEFVRKCRGTFAQPELCQQLISTAACSLPIETEIPAVKIEVFPGRAGAVKRVELGN